MSSSSKIRCKASGFKYNNYVLECHSEFLDKNGYCKMHSHMVRKKSISDKSNDGKIKCIFKTKPRSHPLPSLTKIQTPKLESQSESQEPTESKGPVLQQDHSTLSTHCAMPLSNEPFIKNNTNEPLQYHIEKSIKDIMATIKPEQDIGKFYRNNDDDDNTFQKLYPDDVPMHAYNNLRWLFSKNFFHRFIDLPRMEQEFGKKYTKNLIYSIMNDEYGSFYFRIISIAREAREYIGLETTVIQPDSEIYQY